ncbi:hypothetical protein PAHAL_2G143400 [Panicum hallii]|uniref:Uncharacterized protein n=1 Tax=Panicum hallii TaxID=206008 RepID=A0A2S3GXZ4_9POAL|nr:hypothetical protein PAHAL_2G143400 [Panicum hallii]
MKLNNTLKDQPAEAQVQYETAETRASKAEERHRASRETFRVYREALSAGITQLREEVPRLLPSDGLTALKLAGLEDIEIQQFFQWLRACLAMVDSGSHLYGDLCAIVSTRTLAAPICNLVPTEGFASQGILKAQLHVLWDCNITGYGRCRPTGKPTPGCPKILPRISLNRSSRRKAMFLCTVKATD